MNFRSSIYMPEGSKDIRRVTWYEAHELGEDYVIAQLTGNPSELRPPMFAWFSRVAREVDRPKTLPREAVIVDTAAEPKEAVAKIMALEVKLQPTHELMDIGEYNRPRVPHYVQLINDRYLPEVPLLPAIIEDAQTYASLLMVRYAIGDISEDMKDRASLQLHLFKNIPRAEAQPS